MVLCFSGTRFYDYLIESNVTKIKETIIDILDRYPQTLVFGTCKGIDLDIFRYFVAMTNVHDRPYIINVCPDTLDELDEEDRVYVEKHSDEIIQLEHPITHKNWYASYQIRNEWMVDNADELYAFPLKNPPKGPKKGGTWNTIKYARRIIDGKYPVTITELD